MLLRHGKQILAPKIFYQASGLILPWLIVLFIVTFSYGCIAGLFIAPADYQQGDGYRIMYVHVPSALGAMAIYLVMAISALITLVWRVKIAAICMSCSAEIGAWYTLLALCTGAIWGKPMWGTWWIWDARLTSVLILFFLYLGFLTLQATIPQQQNRDKACSILAITGVINLPIIHYSVIWWNTLHQGPSISQFAKPAIAATMLWPLLAMITAFLFYYGIILLTSMRNQILLREIKTDWVKGLLRNELTS